MSLLAEITSARKERLARFASRAVMDRLIDLKHMDAAPPPAPAKAPEPAFDPAPYLINTFAAEFGTPVVVTPVIRPRLPILRLRIEDIQNAVGRVFGVTRVDLISVRTQRSITRPRQIAMYLARATTPFSMPQIGRYFGDRDHTTVLHAVRRVEGMIAADPDLAATIAALEIELTGTERAG